MLEIWTSVGVKMAVTHFVTQFTHVSRHFEVYSRKEKYCLGKTFENVVLKNGLCVHKNTLRKKCKKRNKI